MYENTKTAPNTLAPTSEGQSSDYNNIIAHSAENCNSNNDFYQKMARRMIVA